MSIDKCIGGAVKIKKVETGEVREYFDEYLVGEDGFDPYMWQEGNYSCDCNRGDFFARANGEEDPDHDCGDELYKVHIEVDGVVLYSEWGLDERTRTD
jgi:hypothetical protein